MFRNVNSSSRLIRMICFLSNSGSCPEWYSKLPDDSSSSETSSEYKSNDESSQGSLEYHSRQEPESERKQIILINQDEEFTFLNIWFPMPQSYPHPSIQLNELMSTVDLVPKSYDRITDIPGDPNCALGYKIHHFNIDKVS